MSADDASLSRLTVDEDEGASLSETERALLFTLLGDARATFEWYSDNGAMYSTPVRARGVIRVLDTNYFIGLTIPTCALLAGPLHAYPHRCTCTMSTAESLAGEITQKTVLVNGLRLQNADTTALNAAKKKLSKLKKTLGTLGKAQESSGAAGTVNGEKMTGSCSGPPR